MNIYLVFIYKLELKFIILSNPKMTTASSLNEMFPGLATCDDLDSIQAINPIFIMCLV